MKTQPTLLFAMLLLIPFGCDDLPIGFENNIGSSALSGKPPVLKISYTEVAQRKAEFAEGTPKDQIFFKDYLIVKNNNFGNNN